MKKITLSLCILLLSSEFIFGQEIQKIEEFPIDTNFYDVHIDENANIYVINEGRDTLKKITKNDTMIYKNHYFGKIDDISVLNEDKIILLFKEVRATESINTRLRINYYTLYNESQYKQKIDAISGSEFDNMWVYNDSLNCIIYVNNKIKQEIFRTEDLVGIYGMPFKLKKMISTQNRVWAIAKRGIIEINNKGHITNIFRYVNIETVFIVNGYRGFVQKDKIVFKKDNEVKELENTFVGYTKMFFYDDIFFVVYRDKVDMCKIIFTEKENEEIMK